uniref:Uncharacterized protein n=1 Tax=Mus spicilegus TaxID=10103 RepID=A0A8C6IAM5_MUSSI
MAVEALFLLPHNEMVSAKQGEGIYVHPDNKFPLRIPLSAGKRYLDHASKDLAFTCGLIRGGSSNLGIKSVVAAEVSSMPLATPGQSIAHPDFTSSLAIWLGQIVISPESRRHRSFDHDRTELFRVISELDTKMQGSSF